MLKRILFGLLLVSVTAIPVEAQFVSGSTGLDGAFNPSTSTTVQCPQPDCVFNFTTVNVPNLVVVTFSRNPANTPVTILAQGDVTISGTINLDGARALSVSGGLGGPGGFRGGDGGRSGTTTQERLGGSGLGPGGGLPSSDPNCLLDGGGSYGTRTGSGASGPIYGVLSLIPIIGGSGGAGGKGPILPTTGFGGGGGGGGGAILIASSGRIIFNSGIITAIGGGVSQSYQGCAGAGGSGGAVRLVANAITGSGYIYAYGYSAGSGRVRLESGSAIPPAIGIGVSDEARSIHIFQPFAPPSVAIPGVPTLVLATLDGAPIPYPPLGQYGPADVTLTTPGLRTVGLAATLIPLGTTIQVTVKPANGPVATVTSTALEGTLDSSTASAAVNFPDLGSYFLEARATFMAPTGGMLGSLKVNGEKVKQMRVQTENAAGSRLTYILESGKEIPSEKAVFARSASKR